MSSSTIRMSGEEVAVVGHVFISPVIDRSLGMPSPAVVLRITPCFFQCPYKVMFYILSGLWL